MTKLNWDRVNMENLMARRGGEYWGDEVLPPLKTEFGYPVSKTLRSRKRSRTIPPGSVACEHCSATVSRKNLTKHIQKVHSKLPNARQVPTSSNKSRQLNKVSTGTDREDQTSKRIKNRKINRPRSVDVLYSQNNERLAVLIAERLKSINMSVRIVQKTFADHMEARHGILSSYSQDPHTRMVAASMIAALEAVIKLTVEYDSTKTQGGVLFDVWVC